MMRRWGAPLLTAVLVAPACKGSSQGALRELTTPIEQLAVPPPCSPTSSFGLDTVAWGLDVPWALDFTPDDRILITERVGRIRLVEDGVLRREPWATLDVRADDEAGLMGLAVSPDFAETGHVYVVGTFYAAPESGPLKVLDRAYRRLVGQLRNSIAIPYENRVYRLTDRDGHGVEPQLVIDGLRAARLHAGGALAFGPDGMLYVAVGEALDGDAAQSLDMLLGKVLRYRPDGTIPDDNPLSGSPVYAYGFRNVQGLAWHPETGDLFATDHGPSGLPWEAWGSGRDELNLLTPAGNFGWPLAAGAGNGGGLIWPIAQWTPALAPGGLAIQNVVGDQWFGNVLVGGLRGRQLRRVVLARDEGLWRVVCEEALLEREVGRIRAVTIGPDGGVYLTTSNRDGRGVAGPRDDLLLRVVGNAKPLLEAYDRPGLAPRGAAEASDTQFMLRARNNARAAIRRRGASKYLW